MSMPSDSEIAKVVSEVVGAAPAAAQASETPAPDPTQGETPKPRVSVDKLGGEDSPILKERLQRAAALAEQRTRAELLKKLGIEDPEKFAAEREAKEKKLAALEKAEAEREAASLTEKQKLERELARAKSEVENLKKQRDAIEIDRLAERQDATISRIATRLIDPDMTEEASILLARHVEKLSKSEIDNFDEKSVEKFFRELVKKKPQYAPRAAATPAPAPKPIPKKPVTAGASVTAGAPKPAVTNPAAPTKTPKPGQGKATMTRAEVKEFARKQGLNYPT